VFGGVGHTPQREVLARGVDVLVATPGRLLDHIDVRNVVLEGVEMFVLDEADQMLDMGFIRPIRRIVAKLPARRQSLFFSATMPKEIGHLAGELLREPVKVSVTPAATTVERVSQHVYLVETKAKRALLVELFANPDLTRTLVFTRTKRGADRVAQYLAGAGIGVAAIHGNKSQNQRVAALDAFKASKVRALVATDVAARGIDIDLVTHVINYELPNVPESYVHRIGRTARAGAEGIAISLCDAEEGEYLRDIERLTRQSIPVTDRRRDASLAAELDRHHPRRNGGGKRRYSEHGTAQHHARSGPQDRNGSQHRHGPGRDQGRDRSHSGPRNDRQHQRQGDGRLRPHAPAARQDGRRAERRLPASGGLELSGVAFMAPPVRPRHAEDGRGGRPESGNSNQPPQSQRSHERGAAGRHLGDRAHRAR
jgi:ATP-dependent RNA helicase RhlE